MVKSMAALALVHSAVASSCGDSRPCYAPLELLPTELVQNISASRQSPSCTNAMCVLGGMVDEVLGEIPGEEVVEWVAQKFYEVTLEAFTHDRTITVWIATPTAAANLFESFDTFRDDGVDIAWDHQSAGFTVEFHDNGPISGCQAFNLGGCNWKLFVAASNPLMGHNKARVAFLPSDTDRTCHQVWDDMDSWGEHEGQATKNEEWDTYDNPSTIKYTLDMPEECMEQGEKVMV